MPLGPKLISTEAHSKLNKQTPGLTISSKARQTTGSPYTVTYAHEFTRGPGRARIVNHRAKNRVSYTLDSTLESVNRAEQTAESMAAKAGFSDDDRHRISMAVREAAVNAVLHGNAYDPSKKVRVAFENTRDALVITIADEGPGLCEQDVPDPLAPENLLKQSDRKSVV